MNHYGWDHINNFTCYEFGEVLLGTDSSTTFLLSLNSYQLITPKSKLTNALVIPSLLFKHLVLGTQRKTVNPPKCYKKFAILFSHVFKVYSERTQSGEIKKR